jgi:autotransporter-associated beta strand protein
MTITGASTMDVDGTSLTLTGVISGTGSLEKEGAGTLILTEANTYTGATEIDAGVLKLTAGASISASEKVVVGANGVFDTSDITDNVYIESLAGSGSVINGSIAPNSLVITDAKPGDVFSGVISGTGGLLITGGTQTLTGINTYTGPTIVSPGANLIAAIHSIPGDVVNNGSFGFSQAMPGTYANNMSGTGTMVIGGTGVITLTGQNTQTGGTRIEDGASVMIGAVNALSGNQIHSDNGSLGIANGLTLSSLDVTGTVTLTSDIKTTGAQSYENLKLAPSAGQLLTLETSNSDVRITGTLDGNQDKTQSLTINAGTGIVTLGDSVGSSARLYDLIVTGKTIYILADVLTAMTQTYNGSVLIGNASFLGKTPTIGFLLNRYRRYFEYNTNGAPSQIDYLNSNPIYIRSLISEDPEITFNGSVNDIVADTHTLLVAAIAPTAPASNAAALNGAAVINFNGSVGQDAPLYSLNVQTVLNSSQNNADAYLGSINLTGDVTTYSSQTYRANLMTAKSNPQPGQVVFSVWDPAASVNYLLPMQNPTNSNCNSNCGQINLQNPNSLDALRFNGGNNFIPLSNSLGVNNWGGRVTQANALGFVAGPPRFAALAESMNFAKFIQRDAQQRNPASLDDGVDERKPTVRVGDAQVDGGAVDCSALRKETKAVLPPECAAN